MPIRECRSFAELPSPSVVALTYVLHTHDLSNVALRNVIISTCPLHLGDAWRHDSGTAALRHCGTATCATLSFRRGTRSSRWNATFSNSMGFMFQCPAQTVTELLHRKSQSWFLLHFPKTNRHLCRVVACPKRQDSERVRISQNSSPSPRIFRIFNDFHIFIRARCPKNGILTSKGLRFFSKLFHLFSSDIPMTLLTFLTTEARTRTVEVTDGYGWLRRLQLEEVPLWLCKATAKALWQPVLEAIVHWIYCLSLLFAPLLQYLLQR